MTEVDRGAGIESGEDTPSPNYAPDNDDWRKGLMSHRPHHSIVSGGRAREMVAGMNADGLPAWWTFHAGHEEARFTVRRCTRRGDLSGGVYIEARLGRLEPSSAWVTSRYISPGWTEAQLTRALSHLFAKTLVWTYRRAHLGALHKVCEEKLHKSITLESADAFAEKTGRTMIYDEMDYSDIKAWDSFFRAAESGEL